MTRVVLHRAYIHIGIAIVALAGLFGTGVAHGISQDIPGLIISAVQTGDAVSAGNEFIQVTNSGVKQVDITSFCINYAAASSTNTGSHLLCFTTQTLLERIMLPAGGTVTLESNTFHQNYPQLPADRYFSLGFSGSGGHLLLIDASGAVIDKIGWGNAFQPEGVAATAVGSLGVLHRKVAVNGYLQDTDNNLNDFEALSSLGFPLRNGEIVEAHDSCLNIDDIQADVPEGFQGNDLGECIARQVEPPILIPPDSDPPDSEIPAVITPPRIRLSEILPNPTGSDTGNEFIELYNLEDFTVNLEHWTVQTGTEQGKSFTLPNLTITPYGYVVLSNSAFAYTLTNTSGIVYLYDVNDNLVDETDSYTNAPDGQSWSLVDDVWQFTKYVSPGLGNTTTPFIESVESDDNASDTLTPCSSGQERNPVSNRCRKIASDQDSALVPCQAGQVRNVDTNHCRTVASSEKTLTPCKEGQERNAETNRCKNVTKTTPPASDYAVMGAEDKTGGSYMLWAIIGLFLVALGYAIWEWREPLKRVFLQLRTKLGRKS